MPSWITHSQEGQFAPASNEITKKSRIGHAPFRDPFLPYHLKLNVFLHYLRDRFARYSADDSLLLLPTLENDERRDAADAVLLRHVRIIVHVHLEDAGLAVKLLGHRFHRRSDHPARTAPLGPKIYQNRFLRTEHVLLEFGIGYCLCK